MPPRTYVCLFDLQAYDGKVAPALRRYSHDYEPGPVVTLLHEVIERKPARQGIEDYEHWADSIAPDAGHKPSEQTVKELSAMLIRQYCLPMEPQQLDDLDAWLSEHSEWIADLLDGGEELAGGSLEFPYGTGRLVATRQQIHQFGEELAHVPVPEGALASGVRYLRKLVQAADSNPSYTLLLCRL